MTIFLCVGGWGSIEVYTAFNDRLNDELEIIWNKPSVALLVLRSFVKYNFTTLTQIYI
jgi:hypothetical protein